MKVIALIPFRNEEAFLPFCLKSLKGIADEVLGLDDGSTDNSKSIFESYGGLVRLSQFPEANWGAGKEAEAKNTLLAWGRERGGTHFVWLDADEVFTMNFRVTARTLMESLQPGEKLLLQWLSLWKKTNVYRCDAPLWDSCYKDFIVCDDPSLAPWDGFMHLGRTQGTNKKNMLHEVSLADGAVLHLQYVPWIRFQVKQCWYRCVELRKQPRMEEGINARYSFTIDDQNAQFADIPSRWLEGLSIPETLSTLPPSWHFADIQTMFQEYGATYFEGLDIWHVPELRQLFISMTGREPDQQAKIRKSRIQKAVRKTVKSLLPESCINFLRDIKRSPN